MIDYSPSSGLAIKADPYIPEYLVTPDEVIIEEGSSTPIIDKDANLLSVEGTTVDNNSQISGQLGDNPSYTSQNTSVATVTEGGYVSRVSDGDARILVESKGDKQILTIPVSREIGIIKNTFSSWRTGSLAKFINDRNVSLTDGIEPSFDTRYRFSPNLFCVSYSSRLASIADTVNGSSWMGFTAITTRHVVTVAHIGDYTGRTITFGGQSKTLIARYVVPGAFDTAVYLMDSGISDSNVIRIAPANLSLYLPSPGWGFPLWFADRDDMINIGKSVFLDDRSIGVYPASPQFDGFYDTPVVGTSGKPIMVPTMNVSLSLMMVGMFTYSDAGPTIHALDWPSIIPAVDALAGISTGLQPTRASLGIYTQYP